LTARCKFWSQSPLQTRPVSYILNKSLDIVSMQVRGPGRKMASQKASGFVFTGPWPATMPTQLNIFLAKNAQCG
jgi:hypothetical protein